MFHRESLVTDCNCLRLKGFLTERMQFWVKIAICKYLLTLKLWS